ncbi:hypothetical protein V2J09_006091 [Rumex salicifolius]
MAGPLLHSESRRLYSWWWDSHISPKNSKWLQENLTEIDSKVKAMIKIINEDADSFARRAEMYYKKRPELMKLVEEFYRAYRALAERYDNATGELRMAHKTMSEVFPNQLPPMLSDDTPSGSEPSSPLNPHVVRAFFDPDLLCKESDVNLNRKGLKQLNEMFQTGEAVLRELKSAEEKLMGNLPGVEDSQKCKNTGIAEEEMESLKEALAKMEAEKDLIFAKYKQSMEKVSDLEKELNSVQNDAKELDQHASKVENEVKTLKESLVQLEVESDVSLEQYKESSRKLASLEATMAAAREETANWSDRAVKAETESQNLKQDISMCESEKQEALMRYEQSMEKIFTLEGKLLLAEETTKQLNEQVSLAENEIKMLNEKLSGLNAEKEDADLLYQQCLESISILQNELMEAKEEIRRLKSEILLGSAKLRGVEDVCALFEKMNESLKLEADDLVQKIAEKDDQLCQKHTELEKLMSHLQDEESRFTQVQATLNSLQNLHCRSLEEQRDLALELKNGLQMLKNLELCKQDLELEIQHLKEENRGLNDLNLTSSIIKRDMEHEIENLKEIKEKFELEVRKQADQNVRLQRQLHQIKEEIEDLLKKYQDLLHQVESAGIDPKCVSSSIKHLRDEYSRLKEISNIEKEEKEAILKRLEDMEGILEKSAMLESSLSDVNIELERSKEKTKVLQESCNSLSTEKLSLVAEKSALLSQLQTITETMKGQLEKNASMENSLQCANVELEGLRVKSKNLEDVCKLLSNEKSNLESEKSILISQLEFVENNMVSLETRFAKLEDKYSGLEKEKVSTCDQVKELKASIGAEKVERSRLLLNNETRLSGLEDRIDILQEDNKCRKKDFEEQLENAVNAQVEIFILQKFIQGMEEKNYNLKAECQKHADTAKYSERVISELESENMMQHLEMEFLLDQVDNLRRGIFQVLKSLEIDGVSEAEPEVFLPRIPSAFKGIQRDLVEGKDENQQLLIQNIVLSAVIRQLSSEGSKLGAQKRVIDNEFFFLNQKHAVLEHEKDQLLELNGQLDTIVGMKEKEQEILAAQMEVLSSKQEASQKECALLQEEHSAILEVNKCLLYKLSEAEEENHILVEENSAAIVEALSFSNQSVVYKNLWAEKTMELERISEEINHLREAYTDSENEARALKEKLAVKETENLQLVELIQILEEKNQELNVFNEHLNHKSLIEGEQLNQKEVELFSAEQSIKALQDVNTELHITIQGLELRSEGLDVIHGRLEQRISELTQYKEHQEKEIVSLREANECLESDLDLLNEEIEACKIREVILSSELHERSCEFELWEAEASSFYFDLQSSGIREALYEDKVYELSGLCDDLEDVSSKRCIDIETMKDKISFLESESNGLKTELAAYVPAIASLKNNIVSLEQNPVLQNKLQLTGTSPQQVQEITVCQISERHSVNANDKCSSLASGLSELQDMQSRIETIESVMKEIEEVNSSTTFQPNKLTGSGSATPELVNGTRMKDIPLDYISDASSYSNRRKGSDKLDKMLELWETDELDADTGTTEIDKNVIVVNNMIKRKMILDRLCSDAQKLERLSISVQELKRKIDGKKERNYSSKAVEYERLRSQLQDIEDSAVQFAGLNTELRRAIEESPSPSSTSNELIEVEEARKEAEKIMRLEVDVKKVQKMVIKLEGEKSMKKKGEKGFSSIVIRELFVGSNSGRKRIGKNKVRFCGCFKQSFGKQV